MPMEKRRTLRTDSNGNLLEEYRSYGPRLEMARRAGIPRDLLDARGWTGDGNDTTGLFADLVYRLGELPLKGPLHPMTDAEEIIRQMVNVCENVGADWRKAIAFPALIRFVREMGERNELMGQGIAPELTPEERALYASMYDGQGNVTW
jgi:hypothetical protein